MKKQTKQGRINDYARLIVFEILSVEDVPDDLEKALEKVLKKLREETYV